LIPHATDVIQAVLAAMPDPDFAMMEDDVETDELCCFQEALLCVASFVNYFPEQSAPCVDLFFDAICVRDQFERQREAEDKPVCIYCSALALAMPGLKTLNRTECVDITKQFMPWLVAGDHRLTWIISIHQAVAALLADFGREVAADERVAPEIFRHIEQGIAGCYVPQYMCHDWAVCIDIRLMQPMFFALTRFMPLIDWATFDSELVGALERNLTDSRETFRAYSMEIFARIAFMTHECADFYTKAFDSACIGLSSTCLPLQIASLNNLRFLLQTDKTRFEDQRDELFNFLAEFMRLFGDGSLTNQSLRHAAAPFGAPLFANSTSTSSPPSSRRCWQCCRRLVGVISSQARRSCSSTHR
jgi:hypothetical protein